MELEPKRPSTGDNAPQEVPETATSFGSRRGAITQTLLSQCSATDSSVAEDARTLQRRSSIGANDIDRAGYVELAVVWVEKARKGSIQWVDSCHESQMRIYRLRKRVKPLVHFVMFVYLALAVFEEPSWCLGDAVPCADLFDDMESSGLPVLHFQLTNTLEIFCLLVFVARTWLRWKSLGAAFTNEFWHKLLLVNLLLAGTDCVVAVFNTEGIFPGSFRLARVCRPIIFLCCYKILRKTAERVVRSVPGFLSVLVSLGICVFVFTWIGILIFGGKAKGSEGDQHFKTFGESLASMWVLFLTCNNPDVWLRAYQDNRWTFIFFFVYLVLALYLLNNVLLAAVYDSYKAQLKTYLKGFYSNRKQAVEHAFRLLSDNNSISRETWTIFFFTFCNKSYAGVGVGGDDSYNVRRARMAFDALDVDGSGGINSQEFNLIIDVFHNVISFMPRSPPPQRTTLGRLQNLITSGIPIRYSRHQEPYVVAWDKWVDIVIAFDLVMTFTQTVVFLDHNWAGDAFDNSIWMHGNSLYWFTFSFAVFYVLETAVKIWALGFSRFWNNKPFQHRFDLLNVSSLFILQLLFLIFDPPDIVVRLSVLFRIARILRLLNHIKALRDLATIMVKIVPSFTRLFMLLFIVFYLYATLGEQFFGGQIRHNNKRLTPDVPFVQSDYWVYNFNDFVSGMVTLFVLMVINNWNVVVSGFLASTGTAWSPVFFVSFLIIVNLVVLNILMALILESFATLQDEMNEEVQQMAATNAPARLTSQELREHRFERESLLKRVLQEDIEDAAA